ncbi:hypothetical protein FHS94_001630 [Sphingomonas aerophila]|uniref:Uncharacterized protein n=1 Tax=Sphingomonas aerophila TaxID=1344948 RepID=A0A7W9BD76_9SPHN|nr:hypothetical protein [Sphingomonas aerophila]
MRPHSFWWFIGLVALTSCADSAQREAERVLAGTGIERCLAAAHWTRAKRVGAYVEELELGSYFNALDEPPESRPRGVESDFDARLVGHAQMVLGGFLVKYAKDYREAGSPRTATSEALRRSGFDGRLLSGSTTGPGGWIRGEAEGWLSRETDLSCGSDQHNGRFFIIKDFRPAFRVSVR